MASIDTHIKFTGVEGESTHKNNKGEIEVLSWTWDVENKSGSAAGGSGKGKAVPGDFHFTHLYDKSSPVLAKYCASGRHFDEVKLTSCKSGDNQKPFLTILMKHAFISRVKPSGSSGGDIVESVTFSYKDIEFAYKAQDEKGGLTGEVKFGWDGPSTEVR